MAPPKQNTSNHGLGKALMKHRARTRTAETERQLHTTEIYDNKPVSVTQETDLESFLNTATLAGTDFTAERQNVTILSTPSSAARNPYLLSPSEAKSVAAKHREKAQFLRVPRRPAWTASTTAAELERSERDSFLEWRRGLAVLTDDHTLLLTPFERNLEVWRQLWRVVERSQLIVQIVDARNPLRFRCEDLERYIDELGDEGFPLRDNSLDTGARKRKNLLLLNKADLLTLAQRQRWADYFDELGIKYAFFSAANAVALQEAEKSAWVLQPEPTPAEGQTTSKGSEDVLVEDGFSSEDDRATPNGIRRASLANGNGGTPRSGPTHPSTRLLTVGELEQLFLTAAPLSSASGNTTNPVDTFPLTVGLVGYPNVGKSSTINALVGAKKVGVSSTPGKTKHFQTIHLSPQVVLCDCPGLVFPQFASTKADLVCDGVLPIDQMREHTAPVSLVTQRIPKPILESFYGIKINTLPIEEGGSGNPTASELLSTYAIARGFFTSGMGQPDESRAARPILKDYVNAKLLYCHPPPHIGVLGVEFNAEHHARFLKSHRRKLQPTTRVGINSDTFVANPKSQAAGTSAAPTSLRSQALDRDFFGSAGLSSKAQVKGRAAMSVMGVNGVSRVQLFPHQSRVNDDGTVVTNELGSAHIVASSKKHFKAGKAKARSGKGYDV